ncbi:MAG: hypothetical protein Q9162_003805 [Coniocarpon cinnabarinum]
MCSLQASLPVRACQRSFSPLQRQRAATFFARASTFRRIPSFRHTTTPHNHPTSSRTFSGSASRLASPSKRPASNPDRGPASSEDTQTDFNALNVLGATNAPTTSIDECTDSSFLLDSGLKITDGDGVMLVGSEAFVWRPWMAAADDSSATSSFQEKPSQITRGIDLDHSGNGTGGLVATPGVFKIPASAFGILALVWPKPDLLIIGTGAKILPLEKHTRETLQTLGVRIEVLDTRNAASQFNLLATERGTNEVAAAMVPCGFEMRKGRRR